MDSVIEVRDLSKSFGKKVILNKINFTVPRGQIIGLLGENGAGKTTLINSILGLISKDSGTVQILGKSSVSEKARMGVMMQSDITLSRIRVSEIIKLSESYYNSHLSYDQILKLANLSGQQNLLLAQLSGGQKRRLSFALAMTGNPDILFLDEPTNGMDPISRQNFWKEILTLKLAWKTIFVTSHHLDELENVIDRFLILKDSSIIFDGTLADLRHNSSESQIDFDSELLPQLFESLPSVKNAKKFGNHYTLVTTNTNQTLRELEPLLEQLNNIKISQNSLENIFINMSKEDAS
ncbi:ABC transporter ATP-binding protein [Companilactobacillus mishanensis]|uniref:ABC transporter ATP-binding protein n=1 Tax=Companilactobacillus mishanensis TaxID=2486008 RepID=UPI001295AAD1|nr:ABC transporter ATP-binding protein [Companilactobacillus mishanensis]MQS90169.1 ABC transporter ATP-binding protein [Companilactobacillus mishanensis]